MGKAWRELDLKGGGLQAVNALLAAMLRSRRKAYAAWLLFPLGLHRFYLGVPRSALLFPLFTALTLLTALLLPGQWWLLPLLALLGWAAYDLYWIERRVTAFNKELRMRLFLRKGHAPPRNYRGRYAGSDEAKRLEEDLAEYQALKERERAGHGSDTDATDAGSAEARRRAPSFSEQEAMLRELSRRRGHKSR
ncbi:hypothetical protein TVNIR_3413 [Thioalkalivibrio nitratireducens DSM 14787]|uniref:TM2 domain-containing protein n=1 Tax=Thioalkalivibrio nitratireducens (strain DSM 14787 / UNIQEM 213 / ALEN2) TaxID=1255043 RepID=L0DZM7_THIND|nr:TM2 domain-containing protein [Thioalkalivibrio nitratireducens]AGA35049.1 hypothetical protein TVNIR_3413 [Thioalkalivibrio nitratireducens DSM 14787]